MEGLASIDLKKEAIFGLIPGLVRAGGAAIKYGGRAMKSLGKSFGFGGKQSFGKNFAGQAAAGVGLEAALGESLSAKIGKGGLQKVSMSFKMPSLAVKKFSMKPASTPFKAITTNSIKTTFSPIKSVTSKSKI